LFFKLLTGKSQRGKVMVKDFVADNAGEKKRLIPLDVKLSLVLVISLGAYLAMTGSWSWVIIGFILIWMGGELYFYFPYGWLLAGLFAASYSFVWGFNFCLTWCQNWENLILANCLAFFSGGLAFLGALFLVIILGIALNTLANSLR